MYKQCLNMIMEAEERAQMYFPPSVDIYLAGLISKYSYGFPDKSAGLLFLQEDHKESGDISLLRASIFSYGNVTDDNYFIEIATSSYYAVYEETQNDTFYTLSAACPYIVTVLNELKQVN